MGEHLTLNGFEIDSANIFKALLSPAARDMLVTFASQQLVAKGHGRTNVAEMLKFLATKFLCSRINTSAEIAWRDYLEPLASRHNVSLMEIQRFNQMCSSIRGYAIRGRNGDKDEE